MTKLEDIRKQRGISRDKLCHAAGLSLPQVNNLCRIGVKNAKYRTVERLAAVLGTTVEEMAAAMLPAEVENQGGQGEVGAESKAVE